MPWRAPAHQGFAFLNFLQLLWKPQFYDLPVSELSRLDEKFRFKALRCSDSLVKSILLGIKINPPKI